jgi:hypothetical protein
MTLKLGSKGEAVKTLQEFLKITVDGNFGPKTESAVKSWQKTHGLLADGIVGKKTWAAMGILNTDNAENLEVESALKIIKHYMPENTYFKGPVPKDWIFLHHTAGWENPYQVADMWARDNRGNVATEFILGGQSIKDGSTKFDGELIQCFPEGGYGWHTGTGNSVMHRNSVAIETCNMGQITKGGYYSNGKWVAKDPKRLYTYVGTTCADFQVVKIAKPFRGYEYWHRYSDAQIQTLRNWILFIANKYNIDPRVGLVEYVKAKGANGFDVLDLAKAESTPGMYSHTNIIRGKVDMFPQQELIDMLLSL